MNMKSNVTAKSAINMDILPMILFCTGIIFKMAKVTNRKTTEPTFPAMPV